MNKSFISYQLENGLIADLSKDKYPTLVRGIKAEYNAGLTLDLFDYESSFGYIYSGEADLILDDGYRFTLYAGMYFCAAAGYLSTYDECEAILITRKGYQGMFSIGGPIELAGRLRYIDGCTDSLLIPPVLKGDPCLNALYFPPYINQTQHTHPSMRVGIVVSGRGECITPDESISLVPGEVFVIPADGLHSFKTDDSPMTVIAYHPDSTYGPTHEQHPMIQRTYVDGVSASCLPDIQTKEMTHAS